MPPQQPARYDLKELAARAGVTARTIHFYIAQGLLPPAGQPGPGARYREVHLARLILIRRLQREHLPLAEIRSRLRSLDEGTVLDLAARTTQPPEPAAQSSPPHTSALDYIRGVLGQSPRHRQDASAVPGPASPVPPGPPASRGSRFLLRSLDTSRLEDSPSPVPFERSQWDRVALSPDIELHIRRPLTRDENRRVERLVQTAREILTEGDV